MAGPQNMGNGMWNMGGRYAVPSPLGLQLNEEVFKELNGQRGVDAVDWIIYDTARFKAATATGAGLVYNFFTTGLGQSESVANSGAEIYKKTLLDTNLQDGNRLPQGQCMIVDSIQMFITLAAQTDTTYPTSGNAAELPSNPTPAAGSTAVNELLAVQTQFTIQFNLGEKAYESGPVYQFPCEFGQSGFAGFGISTNYEGVSNNGFGRPRRLAVQHLIPSLVNFSVTLNCVQALTLPRQFVIGCLLKGFLLRPLQ